METPAITPAITPATKKHLSGHGIDNQLAEVWESPEIAAVLEGIAKSELRVPTLEDPAPKNGPNVHELATWALKNALAKAFLAGRQDVLGRF